MSIRTATTAVSSNIEGSAGSSDPEGSTRANVSRVMTDPGVEGSCDVDGRTKRWAVSAVGSGKRMATSLATNGGAASLVVLAEAAGRELVNDEESTFPLQAHAPALRRATRATFPVT